MASIQSLGVGSGLLTTELVDSIIKAERDVTELRLTADREEVDAKISAFGLARGALDKLSAAVSGLNAPSTFTATKGTSSFDERVGVTTSSVASPGVHTVEVNELARSHTLVSKQYADVNSVVGTGTLAFRFGTTSFDGGGAYAGFAVNGEQAGGSITIDASNGTLAGVRDAVNQANLGVSAAIINDGTGFRLAFTSTNSGAESSLEITATEGATAGLAAFSFNQAENAVGVNLEQAVAATDASFTVDGVAITRTSNSATGVIDGVTFNLLEAAPGSPVTISVSHDTEAAVTRVQAFVDAYNELKDVNTSLTAVDLEEQTASLLTGDSTLRSIMTLVRRTLNSAVESLGAGSAQSLAEIGITSNQNDGYRLQFDSSALNAAIAADSASVAGLLSLDTRSSDSQIQVLGYTNATQAGTYDINVVRQATQAEIVGATVAGLAGGVTIDADNDELIVRINETTSEVITLRQGVYADGAALALELQTQINADANLRALGLSVTAGFDAASEQLTLTGGTYGSQGKLGITAVDPNTAADFGLNLVNADFNVGLDVAGTINGVVASGSGQVLSVPSSPVTGATSARFDTAKVSDFSAPVVIDANNSDFEISVDGSGSNTISLTAGSYADGASLATEIQTQINADATLSAAGVTVTVNFDSRSGSLSIVSDSTGSNSQVAFTDVPSETGTTLGIAAVAGLPGQDASTRADDAALLQVRVLGGALGARGDATLIRGLMDDLGDVLDGVLAFDGLLQNRLDGLGSELERLDEDTVALDRRLGSLEVRLRSQFSIADALISQLNTTSDFLTQQLDVLSAQLSNRK